MHFIQVSSTKLCRFDYCNKIVINKKQPSFLALEVILIRRISLIGWMRGHGVVDWPISDEEEDQLEMMSHDVF